MHVGEYTDIHDPVPSRYNEALQPRFPIGISKRSFEIAVEYLDMLEYTGPVGLSCDDTKLVPGLDPVYDKDRNGFVVLGGVGDPMPVADPEELNAAIAAGRISKAEKVGCTTCSEMVLFGTHEHAISSSVSGS